MSLYKEIIRSGISLKHIPRIVSNIFWIFRSGPKTGKPFMLKIESSALCNLRCRMCPLNKGLSRKTGVLKFENFKKVYDEIRPPYLNLTGIGEPLINKELFKIIKYARKKGSLVKLDTNATLLNKEKIKQLVKSGPTFISVSIDSPTKKNYEAIRIGAKFNIVKKNIKNLVEYRNNIKSDTQIHLFFVLQKINILDITKVILFGEEMGVDAINGTVVISMGKNKNKDNTQINDKSSKEIREKLKMLKKNAKIKLNIEAIEKFLECGKKDDSGNPCFWPWYQTYITWDGYVTPCCIFCDNEIVFGNAFKDRFMKIWNNDKAREFRNNLKERRVGVCAVCGVDESFISEKLNPLYKIPLINSLSFRDVK